MPIPGNLTVPEIPGSSEKEGREGTSDVYQFSHDIHLPIDQGTGQPSGQPIVGPLKVVKRIDKATPLLHNALCTSKSIDGVKLDLYRIDPATKAEQKYYSITMNKVRISDIRPYMPDTLLVKNERQHHMEEVSFVFGEIEWEWIPDSIMAAHQWTPPTTEESS